MIQIYQGVDIVENAKFNKVFSRNKNFIYDIFTEKERAYCLSCRDSTIHFSGRFASKEACMKALGIGMSGSGIDHAFHEIEVVQHTSGKPILIVRGWVAKISDRKKINQFTVSISHSLNYTIATVILVSCQP